MEQTKKIFTNKSIIILYSLAFLGLTSFAIWDIKNIIIDYIEDNRFSLVKLQHASTRGFLFLKNPTICLFYPNQIYSRLIPSGGDFTETVLRWWRREDVAWPTNTSEFKRNLTLNFFQIYVAYNIIRRLDLEPEYVDYVSDILSINRSELHLLIDNFLNDPDILKNVKFSRSIIQKIFIQRWQALDKVIAQSHDYIQVNYLSENQACFLINFVDGMHISTHRELGIYGLDLLNKTDFNFTGIINMVNQITIVFPDKTIYFRPQADAKNFDQHTISISNRGVFDKRHFYPCTSDFDTEDECLRNIKLRAISKICQCTQFNRLIQENTTIDIDSRSFCTSRIYEKCWEKANHEIMQRQNSAKAANKCQPCIDSKNNYEISTLKVTTDAYNKSVWLPRVTLKFLYADESYLLYEERQQFNFSQLISQIGGDLGLYIGFSMIGCLQTIIFFYRLHQKKKTNKSTNRWVQFFMPFLNSNFDQSNKSGDNQIQQDIKELKQIVQKNMLQSTLFQQITVQRLERLEESIRDLNQKLNKIVFCPTSKKNNEKIMTTNL